MKLSKQLSLLDVFCIATGAMISSGLFILPGIAHSKAGPAVVVSYFLAGLLALTGLLSVAELSTAMPKAAGDYFFVTRSMGNAVGTVAGLLSWLALSLKSSFALIGMAAFTVRIIPLPIHIIAICLTVFFLIVNILGVKEAGKLQVILVLSLLLFLLFYMIYGFPKVNMSY
ncbi:amino acid permease, partial [bacterium]|nr:amino acid permease [bacterium]